MFYYLKSKWINPQSNLPSSFINHHITYVSKHTTFSLSAEQQKARVRDMAVSYKGILERVGEDPARPGLLKTPERAAKALMYFTKGYEENIAGETCFSNHAWRETTF